MLWHRHGCTCFHFKLLAISRISNIFFAGRRLIESSFRLSARISSTNCRRASGDDAVGCRENPNEPDDGWAERELFRARSSVSAISEIQRRHCQTGLSKTLTSEEEDDDDDDDNVIDLFLLHYITVINVSRKNFNHFTGVKRNQKDESSVDVWKQVAMWQIGFVLTGVVSVLMIIAF